MTRVALYARYSSDNQRDASIENQLRQCRERAAREGWTVVERPRMPLSAFSPRCCHVLTIADVIVPPLNLIGVENAESRNDTARIRICRPVRILQRLNAPATRMCPS